MDQTPESPTEYADPGGPAWMPEQEGEYGPQFGRRSPRGFPAPALSESDRLETGETVQYLGKDPTAVYTPDIPRHAEMVEYVCRQIDCDPARLDVYRVRIDYPIIPTSIGMEHDLPAPPGSASE